MKKIATLHVVAIIFALCAVLYGRALWFDFAALDDPVYVLGNPVFKLPLVAALGKVLTIGGYYDFLPVRDLSYLLDKTVGGGGAFVFHLTNLVLFFLCALLVYRFAVLLGMEKIGGLISAVFFIVMPIHVEAAVWISSRKDLLVLFFSLGAVCVYLDQNLSPLRRVVWAVLFTFLAAFSKASGAVLPLFFMYLCFSSFAPFSDRSRRVKELGVWLLLFVGLMGIHLLQYRTTGAVGGDSGTGGTYPEPEFVVGLRFLPVYFLHALVGAHLSPFYCRDIMVARNYIPSLLVSIVVIVSFVILLALIFGRKRWFLPAVAFSIVSFLPYSNLLSHEIVFADRYFLGASVLFCLCFGGIVESTVKNSMSEFLKSVVFLALLSLFAWYSYISFELVNVWRSDLSLWRRIALMCPRSPRFLNVLGEIELKHGNRDIAYDLFVSSSVRSFDYPDPFLNLAELSIREGDLRSAERLIKTARSIAVRRNWYNELIKEGGIWERAGFYDRAAVAFSKASELRKGDCTTLRRAAGNWFRIGNYVKAGEFLFRTVRLPCKIAEDFFNLGETCFRSGDFKCSVESFERGLSSGEAAKNIYLRLAQAYLSLNDPHSALRVLKNVLKRDPSDKNVMLIYQNIRKRLEKFEHIKRDKHR